MPAAAEIKPSNRLRYRPVAMSDLDRLHHLLIDPHVRKYLMDGKIENKDWVREQIKQSRTRMAETGLGIWLVYELSTDTEEPIGIGGFISFPDIADNEPELLYALYETHTGKGFATEIARAMIAHGFEMGLPRIFSAVDDPNEASKTVLKKLGFRVCGTAPGAFGHIELFELPKSIAETSV